MHFFFNIAYQSIFILCASVCVFPGVSFRTKAHVDVFLILRGTSSCVLTRPTDARRLKRQTKRGTPFDQNSGKRRIEVYTHIFFSSLVAQMKFIIFGIK